ncbi:hypothetical protein F5X99DRAFT_238333 [Biscogniauxia marginata]|nr:hypothetical protein F5X99DRAFT_238333 [Biscogniauxia marginata]
MIEGGGRLIITLPILHLLALAHPMVFGAGVIDEPQSQYGSSQPLAGSYSYTLHGSRHYAGSHYLLCTLCSWQRVPT